MPGQWLRWAYSIPKVAACRATASQTFEWLKKAAEGGSEFAALCTAPSGLASRARQLKGFSASSRFLASCATERSNSCSRVAFFST